jgi:Flp pilus assembly protein TadD
MAHPRRTRPTWLLLASALLPFLASCQSRPEVERGDALFAEGRNAEALAIWQQALAKHPTSTRLLTQIATAQVRLKRFEDAEATMKRAVALEPDNAKVRQNLALVYLWKKDLDKALAAFHDVLRIQDTYPETNYYIGLIHEMRGDEATAVKYYVLDVNNGPSRAWERLELYKERQRKLGIAAPKASSRGFLMVSLAFLAVAAAAYGLRLAIDARQQRPPTRPGN